MGPWTKDLAPVALQPYPTRSWTVLATQSFKEGEETQEYQGELQFKQGGKMRTRVGERKEEAGGELGFRKGEWNEEIETSMR